MVLDPCVAPDVCGSTPNLVIIGTKISETGRHGSLIIHKILLDHTKIDKFSIFFSFYDITCQTFFRGFPINSADAYNACVMFVLSYSGNFYTEICFVVKNSESMRA